MNAVPSRGRMRAQGMSWKAATVKGEGDEESSSFARMVGVRGIERLVAVFLFRADVACVTGKGAQMVVVAGGLSRQATKRVLIRRSREC